MIVFRGSYACPDVSEVRTTSFASKYIPQGDSDNLLILGLCTGQHGNVSMTYRGVACTQVASASSTVYQVSLFRTSAGVGTGTVRAELALTATAYTYCVFADGIEFTGVDPTTPVENVGQNKGFLAGPGLYEASVDLSATGHVALAWVTGNKQSLGRPANTSATGSTSIVHQRTASGPLPDAALVMVKEYNSAGPHAVTVRNEVSVGVYVLASLALRALDALSIDPDSGMVNQVGKSVPYSAIMDLRPFSGRQLAQGGAVDHTTGNLGNPAKGLVEMRGSSVDAVDPAARSAETGLLSHKGNSIPIDVGWTDEDIGSTTWTDEDVTVYVEDPDGA